MTDQFDDHEQPMSSTERNGETFPQLWGHPPAVGPDDDGEGRVSLADQKRAVRLCIECSKRGASVVRQDDSVYVLGPNRIQDLLPAMRDLKQALLTVLRDSSELITLDPATLVEHCGSATPGYEAVKIERCIRQAIWEFLDSIVSGHVKTRNRLVRKRPVGQWITTDCLARLIKEGYKIGPSGFTPREGRVRPEGVEVL